MKVEVVFNDGALKRCDEPNHRETVNCKDALEAFKAVANIQEWDVDCLVTDIVGVDQYFDSDEVITFDGLTDETIKNYLQTRYNGDWIAAITRWLDEDIDISGSRFVSKIFVDGKEVYSF